MYFVNPCLLQAGHTKGIPVGLAITSPPWRSLPAAGRGDYRGIGIEVLSPNQIPLNPPFGKGGQL